MIKKILLSSVLLIITSDNSKLILGVWKNSDYSIEQMRSAPSYQVEYKGELLNTPDKGSKEYIDKLKNATYTYTNDFKMTMSIGKITLPASDWEIKNNDTLILTPAPIVSGTKPQIYKIEKLTKDSLITYNIKKKQRLIFIKEKSN